ncbi:hypothetical protein E3983_12805 [Legionella israelensis]|uniref:Uncharacterized protein n=1 Tax=Legionella israelensis TaxID=454 RepID=A0AAX1EJ28_9GAMM|nr:hypothetical protein [Legionella israelensis]QBR85153.1 hypothetical protein E3983_12805 [Legionella israelensis]
MKAKKIPLYLLIFLLTLGASVTVGFLSFGGMLALWPILPLAIGAFALSTSYEGEVYFQNIKNGLNKLFKPGYIKQDLAKKFLLNHFPKDKNRPEFFNDYEEQLKRVEALRKAYKKDKSLKQEKELAEKALRDMDKWFARQLFRKKKLEEEEEGITEYQRALLAWLKANGQNDMQALYKRRYYINQAAKVFSLVAGVFMGLGTSYLFAESLAAMPLLSALLAGSVFGGPIGILIASLIVMAGIAYAVQTYNSIMDMVNNEVLQKWYKNIKEKLSKGFTIGNVVRVLAVVTLVILAVALTLCTAGTWFTIAKAAKPLYTWMSKIPGFIMGIISPIVLGLSTGVFCLNNSYESYTELEELTHKDENEKHKSGFFAKIKEGFKNLRERENWLQLFNPFRLLLKITVTPIRILLFLGHLTSIGVNADRVPGIPNILTALLGVIAEGFEDLHYFMDLGGHHHHHGEKSADELRREHLDAQAGHDHSHDIPTQIVKFIFSPLYFLSAVWDWATSKLNTEDKKLSFVDACKRQRLFIFDYFPDLFSSHPPSKTAEKNEVENAYPVTSTNWKLVHAQYRIERYEEKHFNKTLVGRSTAKSKINELHQLKNELAGLETSEEAHALHNMLTEAKDKPVYNQHRWFSSPKETSTQRFINDLPQRIGAPAA